MYKEEFKDIKNYEGYYQISNAGRVRSLKRKVKNTRGYRIVRERILKPSFIGPEKKKYLKVILSKNRKCKIYAVHRLLMNTFKSNPNPEYLTEIDHIRNGDTLCNFITSLEWVTHSENQRRSWERDGRRPPMNGKTGIKIVLQFTKDKKFITEFESIQEAERQTGINQGNICSCCQEKLKSAGGYKWKYKNEKDRIRIK